MKKIQTDEKQNIKKQRIVTYFIEATKEIIIKEGVEKVTARKVADLAGYSYATIYNYFNDINDLLMTVKKVMIRDIAEYLQKRTEHFAYDVGGIKKIFQTYMEYFFEYPNVFRFFYFTPIINTKNKQESIIEEPEYNMMWKMTFQGLIQEGKVKEEDLEILTSTIIYMMHGMLTLSFSNSGELTREKVNQDLEKLIDYLL